MSTETISRKQFTRNEYNRMWEAGIFAPGARYELIRGDVVEMPRTETRHDGRVNRLNRLFSLRLEESVIVSVQNKLVIGESSVPRPDIALLKPLDLFFGPWAPEPADVFLVVEVSDTTIHYDTDVKMPLYAENGVRECWLLDIQGDSLVVFSEPADGSYTRREVLGRGKTVTIGALPSFFFAVEEILD